MNVTDYIKAAIFRNPYLLMMLMMYAMFMRMLPENAQRTSSPGSLVGQPRPTTPRAMPISRRRAKSWVRSTGQPLAIHPRTGTVAFKQKGMPYWTRIRPGGVVVGL